MKRILMLVLCVFALFGCQKKYNINDFLAEYSEFSNLNKDILETSESSELDEQKKFYQKLILSNEFSKWKSEGDDVIQADISGASLKLKDILETQQELVEEYIKSIESTYGSLANAEDEDDFNRYSNMEEVNIIKDRLNDNTEYINKIVAEIEK